MKKKSAARRTRFDRKGTNGAAINVETQTIFRHLEKYRKSCEGATGRRPSSGSKGPTYGEERIAVVNKLEKLVRESLVADRKEVLVSLLDSKLNGGGAQWSFRSPRYHPIAAPLIHYFIYRKFLTQREAEKLKRSRVKAFIEAHPGTDTTPRDRSGPDKRRKAARKKN